MAINLGWLADLVAQLLYVDGNPRAQRRAWNLSTFFDVSDDSTNQWLDVSIDFANVLAETDVSPTAVKDTAGAIGTADQFARADHEHSLGQDLLAATGNEISCDLSYAVNKATSGNDTGLRINVTDTASPGTSKYLSCVVDGGETCSVTTAGVLSLGAPEGPCTVTPATGAIALGSTSTAPALRVTAPASDAATAELQVAGQAAFASAVTNTTGGNVAIMPGAPAGSGTYGHHDTRWSTTRYRRRTYRETTFATTSPTTLWSVTLPTANGVYNVTARVQYKKGDASEFGAWTRECCVYLSGGTATILDQTELNGAASAGADAIAFAVTGGALRLDFTADDADARRATAFIDLIHGAS